MKLSEMRQCLAEGNIQLTKSLGQNFLHDTRQLERIVEAANLQATDRILEIGPGLGPLTERLVAQSNEVLAIEKDRRLFAILEQRFSETPNLQLLQADALKWLQREPSDWSGWKLVANLPYSVASPILVELASAPASPDQITVTLQKEVVKRLAASAADKDYGILSLLVQLRFAPGNWFDIPNRCFFPEPDVESACITLNRRPEPLLPDALEPVFRKLVKLAFSQRRKMMLKLLKQNWPPDKLEQAFDSLSLDPKIRAEKVTLPQFVEMTRLLTQETHPAPMAANE